MIIIYKTIPAKKICQEASESIPKLVKWFKANPTREDCNVKMWYGQHFTLKRGNRASIAKAVLAAAETAINHK